MNDKAFQEFDLPAPGTNRLVLRETDDFLLLREMHHRLANSLTVLTSMLRREFAQLLLPAKCSLPVCFGWFMALLDIQIVASSLQNIGGGLSAAQVEISWIQTAYRVG